MCKASPFLILFLWPQGCDLLRSNWHFLSIFFKLAFSYRLQKKMHWNRFTNEYFSWFSPGGEISTWQFLNNLGIILWEELLWPYQTHIRENSYLPICGLLELGESCRFLTSFGLFPPPQFHRLWPHGLLFFAVQRIELRTWKACTLLLNHILDFWKAISNTWCWSQRYCLPATYHFRRTLS